MQLTIGRLRGGYCVIWTEGGKRRRYQLSARTRKDAEAEALAVYRRHADTGRAATIADSWAAYVAFLGDKPTAKTMGYTGKAILPELGHLPPAELTPEHCRKYAALRTAHGKSQGTIHTELGHLRSALTYAAKLGMIERAPFVWRPEKPIPKERYLTRQEIDRLLDACHEHHILLAVTLLLGTAARVGAILDLTWDRVDMDRAQINLRLSDAKTRKGRAIVPMNGMVRAALATARQGALTDHVIEWGGKPVRSIRKGFANAAARAGLEGVTLHTLRHTAAVTMAEAGIPMEKISQYLGHSNVQITASTYARYAPDHMRDAAEVLDFSRHTKRSLVQ